MPVSLEETDKPFAHVRVDVPGMENYEKAGEPWCDALLEKIGVLAARHRAALGRGTVWLTNSTPFGGGVAEMLPHHVSLLRDIGVDARWVIFDPKDPGFFGLTKRVHNALHDQEMDLTLRDREIYDAVSKAASGDLGRLVGQDDLLIVHDLQPVGAAAHFLKNNPRPAAWRCHIGYPQKTGVVDDAWDFLAPYFAPFKHTVFTAPEYGRPMHKGQVIIPPTLDPFSAKNRIPASAEAAFRGQNALAAFGAGGGIKGVAPEALEKIVAEDFVLQVARWDNLKGWDVAIDAFCRFAEAGGAADSYNLVLAGPDPKGIADDPEAYACLERICGLVNAVPEALRGRVHLLLLSMDDIDTNAAIISYLQAHCRAALQMSLQEGYGLSLTEVLFKAKPAVARDAFGLTLQIDDGENGYLVGGPDAAILASRRLSQIAADPALAKRLGEEAQRRCRQGAVQLGQLHKWIGIIASLRGETLAPEVPAAESVTA